jgi:hypothetical protein
MIPRDCASANNLPETQSTTRITSISFNEIAPSKPLENPKPTGVRPFNMTATLAIELKTNYS